MSLRIDLRASMILLCLQTAQIALAVVAAIHLANDFDAALWLLFPIGAAAHTLFQARAMPRALVLMSDQWHLVYEQEVLTVELCDEFHSSPWLQILHFKQPDNDSGRSRNIRVILLPDSAAQEERRNLRVLLRWYRFPAVDPATA